MANPQAEDGHVDIANEIMEALAKIRIPGEARQILDFILRKTYGWHKKEDSISLTQFEKGTGLERNQVCRGLRKLLQMNLIYKGSDNGVPIHSDNTVPTISIYGFQKDFDKWKGSYNPVTSDKSVTGGSDKDVLRVVTKVSPTKETIQKKTKQKKGRTILMADEEFWKEVKKIYTWVDINREIQKMKGYMLTPKGKRWRMTQQRVIEWLGRIDRPLQVPREEFKPQPSTGVPDWIKDAKMDGWKV